METVTATTWPCLVCGRRCRSRASLARHLQGHTPAYACSDCDYTTRDPVRYDNHVRMHRDPKPFKCPDCPFTARDVTHLRVHQRTHTALKPFSCPECNHASRTKSNLLIHLRVHRRRPEFTCAVCHKSFTQKAALRVHQRLHTDPRPFACPYCPYRGNQRVHLGRHVHAKHPSDARWDAARRDACEAAELPSPRRGRPVQTLADGPRPR